MDDPITDVENIERYFKIGKWAPKKTVLLAVQEIRPALVMSTIAVILSFIPMFFIRRHDGTLTCVRWRSTCR